MKNLGTLKYKVQVINYLDEFEISIFNLSEIKEHFNNDFLKIFRAIKSMTAEGILLHVQKGIYCRPSFRNDYVLAYYLARRGGIAYWTALNLHGLTTQFPNIIFVQTPTKIISKKVMGVFYQFVQVKVNKASLYEFSGRGNNRFAMTSIEKTLVDCFDLMDYSAGWTELIKALYKAKLNELKLIEACEIVDNISVVKRLGYLIELMKKKNMRNFLKYAKSKINSKYNLLDPTSEDLGTFNAQWRLRLNVMENEIIDNFTNLY